MERLVVLGAVAKAFAAFEEIPVSVGSVSAPMARTTCRHHRRAGRGREAHHAAEAYFGCARKWSLNRKGPKGLSQDEAKKLFDRYLGKITNPIALEHYKILMKRAVKGK